MAGISNHDVRRFPIVDSHEDIAFNSVVLGRDFLLSALEKRRLGASASTPWGLPTVGFSEMERANVRVAFGSIWAVACQNPTGIPVKPCYETPEEACEQGEQQLSYYENLTSNPRISIVRTKRSIEDATEGEYHLGLVISMEGADPIVSPKDLHEWVKRGVRVVGLAHGRTRYSGGTRQPGSLTKSGRELLSEMEHESVILDTSHMAEESFFEALDLFKGPVIATHSNCRALVDTDRQLSDEMIRAIVKREGVIGIVLFNKFLIADWDKTGKVKQRVTLADVMKHVQHVRDVAGNTANIGIGSDLDGGFGTESIPAELDTIADLPKIADALLKAGFAEGEAIGIMGENWLRFLKASLPT
jgi:membrane dipeptidase